MVKLSEQQQRVYELWIKGFLVKQIAHDMGISPKTVSTHKARIVAKLKLDSHYYVIKEHWQSVGRKRLVWSKKL